MPLTTVQQLAIKSEAELERLLEKCPSAIEEGLQILGRQVPAGRGLIDILAVDADGALVVIELKKESDDHALIQGLEYYDFVRDYSERFASIYSDYKTNAQVEPRLLLIAKSFNPRLLAAARYVDASLTLYTYTYLSLEDRQGIYLVEVGIPPPRDFKPGRLNENEHIDRITNDAAKQACRKVIEWLRQRNTDVETHGRKDYISVKYKGSNFVDIRTRLDHFNIFFWRSDWKRQVKITSLDDFTDEIQDQLRQCLKDRMDIRTEGLVTDIPERTGSEG